MPPPVLFYVESIAGERWIDYICNSFRGDNRCKRRPTANNQVLTLFL